VRVDRADQLREPTIVTSNDPDIDCTSGPPLRERGHPTTSLVQCAFEQARDGDRAAAGFLYARYGDEVYEYMRATLGDHARAREATRCIFAFGEAAEWAPPQLASPRASLLDGARRLVHQAAADPGLRLSA
jgi:hypothetical protein